MCNMAEIINNFKKIPEEYGTEVLNTGSIEVISYDTRTYDEEDKKIKKDLLVYLPEGYDHNDKNKKYNILYLMHGGGENEGTIFGPDVMLQNILDHLIKDGVMEPMIVVTPTFNRCTAGTFWLEWAESVIPFVEGKYSTYAKSTSIEDIIASRRHRAFGGFSMGGICTWSTFQHALELAAYYMPISGDNWEASTPDGKAQGLVNAINKSGLSKRDYFIMTASGQLDFMYPANLGPQIDAMRYYEEFVFTSDLSVGNTWFVLSDYGTHDWSYVKDYVYDMLPYFFHE